MRLKAYFCLGLFWSCGLTAIFCALQFGKYGSTPFLLTGLLATILIPYILQLHRYYGLRHCAVCGRDLDLLNEKEFFNDKPRIPAYASGKLIGACCWECFRKQNPDDCGSRSD